MKILNLFYRVWVVFMLVLILASILVAFDFWEDTTPEKHYHDFTTTCDEHDRYGRKVCSLHDVKDLKIERKD